jgi:hypothetical protein
LAGIELESELKQGRDAMTQSTDRKAPDPFEFVQRTFSLSPQMGEDARQNLRTFWKKQSNVLDSMQEFSRGWFERRHDATIAALDAATCMCDAQNPAEAIQHYHTWAMGSAERTAADVTAWQKHVMNAMESVAAPLSEGSEGYKADISTVSRAA